MRDVFVSQNPQELVYPGTGLSVIPLFLLGLVLPSENVPSTKCLSLYIIYIRVVCFISSAKECSCSEFLPPLTCSRGLCRGFGFLECISSHDQYWHLRD